MDTKQLVSYTGVFLVVAGIVLTGIQVAKKRAMGDRIRQEGLMEYLGPLKIRLATVYPGLILSAFGAVLLIVALSAD